MEVPEEVRGVIVTDVDEASPAAGRIATPQTGGPDIIVSVEGVAVTTPDALKAALRSAKPGDIVSLRIYNMPAKSRRIERVRLMAAPDR
jgi:S1-C subfamily serine protease